jgi:ribosomal protein S27AE
MNDQRLLDRRQFLRGSLLAAAVGLAVALPASAQDPAKPAPDEKKPDPPKKDVPPDGKPAEKKGVLLDKQGREYRVCDMCGGNMYVEEKRWTCDQCGFSYEV